MNESQYNPFCSCFGLEKKATTWTTKIYEEEEKPRERLYAVMIDESPDELVRAEEWLVDDGVLIFESGGVTVAAFNINRWSGFRALGRSEEEE